MQMDRSVNDDRIHCSTCREYAGICLAAKHGRRKDVATNYQHPDLLHRCEFYLPKARVVDQRLGRERWPDLFAEYEARIGRRAETGIRQARKAIV